MQLEDACSSESRRLSSLVLGVLTRTVDEVVPVDRTGLGPLEPMEEAIVSRALSRRRTGEPEIVSALRRTAATSRPIVVERDAARSYVPA